MQNHTRKEAWQQELHNLITSPKELLSLLQLKPEDFNPPLPKKLEEFPLRIPRSFAARIQPGNPLDPLLLQALPQEAENSYTPGFSSDPTGEQLANPIPGLLHKYYDRVLLTLTQACAIHCRYCFRRDFPYSDNNPGRAGWEQALNYIAQRPEITEVILSGGDPLMVSDDSLKNLLDRIETIAHITRIRVHTRLPIMIPKRITQRLCHILSSTRCTAVMVIHCNHAQEIDETVAQALNRLREYKITLLNQSVLLRGINDSVEDLSTLSHRLFESGVLPYYLHILDKVQGSAHFWVDETRGSHLIAEMLQQISGYLVPRLVQEQAGARSKVPIPIIL